MRKKFDFILSTVLCMAFWLCSAPVSAGEAPGAARALSPRALQLAADLLKASSLHQVAESYPQIAKITIERRKNSPECKQSTDCQKTVSEVESRFLAEKDGQMTEINRGLEEMLAGKFTEKELEVLIKIQRHSVLTRFNDFLNSEESFQPVTTELEKLKAQLGIKPAAASSAAASPAAASP